MPLQGRLQTSTSREPAAEPAAKWFHCERTRPTSPIQRSDEPDSYRDHV